MGATAATAAMVVTVAMADMEMVMALAMMEGMATDTVPSPIWRCRYVHIMDTRSGVSANGVKT